MRFFTKINHGIEYLYALIGKRQIYIAPKDDPEKVKKENVYKAINLLKKQVTNNIQESLNNLDHLLVFLPEPERKEYLKSGAADFWTSLRLQARGETPILQAKTTLRSSALVIPLIQRMQGLNLKAADKRKFGKLLTELKKVLEDVES